LHGLLGLGWFFSRAGQRCREDERGEQ